MAKSWLIDIPPEIRNKIYVQVFRSTPVNVYFVIQNRQPWLSCWNPARKACIGLLLTSKKVLSETKQLFLDESSFHIGQHECVYVFHIVKDDPAFLPHIQHLQFSMTQHYSRFARVMMRSWRGQHKLHEITIQVRRFDDRASDEPDPMTQSDFLEVCLESAHKIKLNTYHCWTGTTGSLPWYGEFVVTVDQARRVTISRASSFHYAPLASNQQIAQEEIEKAINEIKKIKFFRDAREIVRVDPSHMT